jgi:catechol 2,3-dioxygenase-like lactoylglutathione lyase family enzyme
MKSRWTHLALHVRSLQASIAFYEQFTNLRVIDRHSEVALAMAPAVAHALELPGKVCLLKEAYVTVQQILLSWLHNRWLR